MACLCTVLNSISHKIFSQNIHILPIPQICLKQKWKPSIMCHRLNCDSTAFYRKLWPNVECLWYNWETILHKLDGTDVEPSWVILLSGGLRSFYFTFQLGLELFWLTFYLRSRFRSAVISGSQQRHFPSAKRRIHSWSE